MLSRSFAFCEFGRRGRLACTFVSPCRQTQAGRLCHRRRAGRPCRRFGRAVQAFSLLELIVVLAVVVLVAGLVAPSLGAGALARQEQRQCAELVTLLAAQRVGAMRAGAAYTVELHVGDGVLAASRVGDPDRVWKDWRTRLADAGGRELSEAKVPFDPVGRCFSAGLSFRARGGSDRIWAVVFDPISGAPSLRQGLEQR